MYELIKQLADVYGAAGRETAVADAVEALLKGKVDSITRDAMGNLICEKKGTDPNGKRIMLSAHMDHIGFIVAAVEKDGFLRVAPVGGIKMDVSLTRHVRFQNGVEGVIVREPLRAGETAEMKHLFIDIGAADREEAEKSVQLGDMAVYAPDCFELGEHRIASPAMDDRCACALLCELLMYLDDPKNTVVGVFSTQEEVGIRGAKVAAYSVQPDLGIAIDVTAWGDTPDVTLPSVQLGKGPAVKFMDASMVATPAVRDAMLKAAEDAGVPAQREVLPFGGTDGAGIQHSRAGVPTGTLSIPCRYVHSPAEVIDMRDMEGGLKLLLKFVENA